MSYIKINIGGKERGLKFNQGADIEYAEKSGNTTNSIFRCYALVWAGLVANCFVKREEVDFSFEDVCAWCDKLDQKIYFDIMDVYKSAHAFEKDIPKEDAENDKKKLASKSTELNA